MPSVRASGQSSFARSRSSSLPKVELASEALMEVMGSKWYMAVRLLHLILEFLSAPGAVAFGAYNPSHMSIKCKEYHCWIPSSLASLSATSLARSLSSSSIDVVMFSPSDSIHESRDVGVDELDEEVEVALTRLCPRVEVLSCVTY